MGGLRQTLENLGKRLEEIASGLSGKLDAAVSAISKDLADIKSALSDVTSLLDKDEPPASTPAGPVEPDDGP